MKWVKFNPRAVKLPRERRYVLLQVDGDETLGMPPSVVVGYLRRHSNRNNFFVIPGFGRNFEVTHWCDCLGDDFHAPLWMGKQTKIGKFKTPIMVSLFHIYKKFLIWKEVKKCLKR